MAAPELLTYYDALQHLTDYSRGQKRGSQDSNVMRRAVRLALDETAGLREWSFLQKQGRVQLHAAQTTGTVAYDHSGGATCERQCTLSGATFPAAWTQDASIKIGDAVHDIESRESSIVVQLDATMNPGQDVAAGTEYMLFPRWYVLPQDFVSFTGAVGESIWQRAMPTSPKRMMELQRYHDYSGDVRYYCVAEVPDLLGSLGLFVWPPSDADETLDFWYRRRSRGLRYTGHEPGEYAGTIAVTAGSDTVTGSGTAFASGMVGSVLRIGSDASNRPEGLEGRYPYEEQRIIRTVDSTTSATLDAAVETTRSGVKYTVTDPVDLGREAWRAFLACCEKNMAILADWPDKADSLALWRDAAFLAKGADARVRQRRVCGVWRAAAPRLADMPIGDEV